ncbi:hypothetical protein WAI453_008856 [Rhynchosporium graminicola]
MGQLAYTYALVRHDFYAPLILCGNWQIVPQEHLQLVKKKINLLTSGLRPSRFAKHCAPLIHISTLGIPEYNKTESYLILQDMLLDMILMQVSIGNGILTRICPQGSTM